MPSLLIHGPAVRLSSFSLVNRQLAAGMRVLGWDVTLLASDALAARAPAVPLPDVYVFFGHPYDLTDAPGRCNVFVLSYDYARFVPADRDLAPRLNAAFDLVVVPSEFAAGACRRSGVTRPIAVCPLGADMRRFRPGRPRRAAVDAAHPFEFLALGGAYERKGTDLLAAAFARAFRSGDAVRLTIKAFSYDHRLPWATRSIARAGLHRAGAPAYRFDHSAPASVAAYYRAADAGVFPFRGEGFGLPILECLASGTPALVTRGGGPLDYAMAGVEWIPAPPAVIGGRDELAPDVDALARLMRETFERGRPPHEVRLRVAGSVRHWTWERTCSTLHAALVTAQKRTAARRTQARGGGEATGRSLRGTAVEAAYAYSTIGPTSWRLTARHVGEALRRSVHQLSSHGRSDPPFDGRADLVVGQSSFCLEAFVASAARRPDARRVLHRESGPYAAVVAIADDERRRCGVPARGAPPMALWRHQQEASLAGTVVVLSDVSRRLFLAAGATDVRVIRPGIARRPIGRARTARSTRFLFVASDPFRKGVRVLFDAWRRAAPPRAELLCVASREMLQSPRLLTDLVAMPSITVVPFLPHRQFLALYETVDCMVLPTFEEGSPFAIADAMARGIPAIVSDRSGTHEILEGGASGWIVPAGEANALAEALVSALDPRRRRRVGEAAYETAQAWTWRRFREEWSRVIGS